jgi:hypothetical protein
MNTLAEDNFNALKYESTEDKEKKNSILNQISALNQNYYECMHDWEQRLNHFVNFLPSGYYKVNDSIYVQKKDFSSGVVKQGGDHSVKLPISWARFEGVIVYDGKETIADSFKTCLSIQPGDTIEVIDGNDFIEVFYPICKRVFADTEENIKLQYDNFPFGFYRILEDYPDRFPKTAYKFNEKLEKMLDEDIDSEIDHETC